MIDLWRLEGKDLVTRDTSFPAEPGRMINIESGRVTHYDTYRPQTNPKDPKNWESLGRFDNSGMINRGHFNKVLQKEIAEPHVHDPFFPGEVRPAEPWEIPN